MRRRLGKRISKSTQLAAVPVRNEALTVERNDRGEVVIVIHRNHGALKRALARIFVVPLVDKRIELDEPGTFVWDMCDGKTDIATIVRRLAERYKLERKEAEVSVLNYLKQMARRRFVGIAVPEASALPP